MSTGLDPIIVDEGARGVFIFKSMRAKVVPLRLDHIGWQPSAPIPIKESQRS